MRRHDREIGTARAAPKARLVLSYRSARPSDHLTNMEQWLPIDLFMLDVTTRRDEDPSIQRAYTMVLRGAH